MHGITKKYKEKRRRKAKHTFEWVTEEDEVRWAWSDYDRDMEKLRKQKVEDLEAVVGQYEQEELANAGQHLTGNGQDEEPETDSVPGFESQHGAYVLFTGTGKQKSVGDEETLAGVGVSEGVGNDQDYLANHIPGTQEEEQVDWGSGPEGARRSLARIKAWHEYQLLMSTHKLSRGNTHR